MITDSSKRTHRFKKEDDEEVKSFIKKQKSDPNIHIPYLPKCLSKTLTVEDQRKYFQMAEDG